MSDFIKDYENLNAAQKSAVDQLDGPILVIAGPGTGKTQLLSARVANILIRTDTLAQNILCLTFTDNGANNMRERLTRFIGEDAYDVNISTYHAFGGELIRRFPEYFGQTRLQTPIDELGRRQVVAQIVDKMSYTNPLKQTRHHLQDLISTISDIKRALLTGQDLEFIAQENQAFLAAVNPEISQTFSNFKRMSSKLTTDMPYFESVLKSLLEHQPAKPRSVQYGSLAAIAIVELQTAIETASQISKTTALTKWKNDWLAKDADNQFILDGRLQTARLLALAKVFDQYGKALEDQGLYDFDDMILRSITALEEHPDLKFTLQEQYQYLLLDEFQDTNAAQFKLVSLLGDNPVNEGRPNILAVGDDDQAIYAFQGAHYSNMLDFYQMYRDTMVVNLTDNYRSHADILSTAGNIASQIDSRLEHHFDGVTKKLQQSNNDLPAEAIIVRREFLSDIAQYTWMAEEIHGLVKSGVNPKEIAVLAPKHRYLEPLVAYLNQLNIPVRYEKREDILETSVVHQLLTMSHLVLALAAGNTALSDSLWPEVLSYRFWGLPVSDIWKLSWRVNDSHGQTTWDKQLLVSETTHEVALLFLTLALKAKSESAEAMLDYLIGTNPVNTGDTDCPIAQSKLRQFYTSKDRQQSQPEVMYETLSHLTVIRSKLREHQAATSETLKLQDFIDFTQLYKEADERMINTSPYNQNASAVQLMTVFKAKGLEFSHVFLPGVTDEIWGESQRGNTNKLTLPKNLAPIRHAGANEDERLRIFFVALTRAKIGLYLTSFSTGYSGKSTKRLKYLNEQEQDDDSFKAQALRESKQLVLTSNEQAPPLQALEDNWQTHHRAGIADLQLKSLLEDRLEKYQLSPTHLNSFIDLEYGGPESFFFNTILRFPSAPTTDGQFGNAIHETLEWLQHQFDSNKRIPPMIKILDYFDKRLLLKHLAKDEYKLQLERGNVALEKYLQVRSDQFKPGNRTEYSFKQEGVFIGKTHLGGKIDRMEIDKQAKTIVVVDYKTGRSHSKWESSLKLHKYKQQLYCYKLLIENSHTFKGYQVEQGRLEFIEPDQEGRINSLDFDFKDSEVERVKQLLVAMWQRVKTLDFPDTSDFEPTLFGSKKFETWLIDNSKL